MIAHILAHGGVILFFIACCSLLALAVILERLLRLLPLRRRSEETWNRFEDLLQQQQLAQGLGDGDPLARVISRALRVRRAGQDAIRIAALEAAQREVPFLERGLSLLAVTAQIAPLLGLLGTVAGLMEAFQAAGASEQVTHNLLAQGIYKALGTTAAGLAVAIPVSIAYSLLAGLASRQLDHLESVANELPLLLAEATAP